MAQSYDRKINLYINVDGKQIPNNVKSINAELQKIVNSQKMMTIGSQDYIDATKKIQFLSGVLKDHKQAIGQMQTPMQKITDFAKGLLPAFGFGALATGAKFLFDKITSGTDAMADQWEFTVSGMKNGLNYFYKTLSSGDWSNFFANMREAVKVGKEYAKMLDHAEDSTRALSMQESDARREELQLELAIKNKTLSKSDRLKAGQDRIKLEEDLSAKRSKIAQEELDAELLIAAQRTGLSKDELISISKDIDSQSKKEAEAYQEKIARLKNLRNQNVTPITEPNSGYVSYVPRPDTPEMKSLAAEIESTPDSIKQYAGALDQYGNLTVDMMDRIAQAYAKKNEAEDSAVENTKKVRNMVNSLLAGQEEDGQKIEDQAAKRRKEAADKAIEILDQAQAQRNSAIVNQYEKEAQSAEWFQEQQLATEMAYLVQKKVILAEFGQSTVEIENQIIAKRIEAQNKLAASQAEAYKIIADEALKLSDDSDKADSDFVTEQIDKTNKAIEDSKRIQEDQAKAEQHILEQRQEAYLNFATMVGQNFGDLMANSEATFGDYLNAVLLMSLEALHQFLIIERAKALIKGAGTGFIGLAKAAAKIVLMEAAYQAVKGLLTPKKHATGGYTEGETTYVAGEAGKEWIAPNWMLQNPVTAGIIEGLENYRRNPVTVSAGAYNATKSISNNNASGFVASHSSAPPNSTIVIQSSGITPEQITRLTNVLARVDQWNPNISIETLERKWKQYNQVVHGGLK